MLQPVESISILDSARLEQLEGVIERGLKTFVDVGTALLEIRDNRLYRQDYATFEDYCRERWGMVASRARQLISASEITLNLESVTNVTLPRSEAQVRPLMGLEPEQQREAWQRAIETAPDGKITAAHVQKVVEELNGIKRCSVCGNLWEVDLPYCPYCNITPEARVAWMQDKERPHVANNSGNNEWYTPPEFIEAARVVMGDIDLDPASSELANRIVNAHAFYTASDSGLDKAWRGRVWMNPPYSSDLVGKFTEKLAYHLDAGDVTDALVLVNNATETNWLQPLLARAAAVCFVKQRVKFIDVNGEASGAPLQGQVVVYFGEDCTRFANEFKNFGVILYG